MVRVAVVGVGKMGISHLSILGAHPDVSIEAMCDSTGFVLDLLSKYTGVEGKGDYFAMLESVPLDAVVIATPTKAHFPMVKAALEKGLHVFCEKPLTLSAAQSRELAELAASRGLQTQVGYHNRFVAAFGEAQRLLDAGHDRRGHARARRGVRPGRPAPSGRHLALPALGGRRLPLRLRGAPARPAHLVPR